MKPQGPGILSAVLWRFHFTSHAQPVCILLLLALLTRFAFFGWPTSSIIDEIYLGNYFSAYFTHEFYMDVHPPLAKLITAGFAALVDFAPIPFGTHWKQQYTDYNYLVLRFLPAVLGTLLVLIVYFLVFRICRNRKLAFLIALLAVFENALVTQSRSLFWENYLLVFGFGSIWAYLRFREHQRTSDLLLTAALAGAAVSVKWIGLSFVAIPVLMDGLELLARRIRLTVWLKTALGMAAAAMLIYSSAFYLHFSLLTHSGPGDPFMSRDFQAQLEGSKYAGDPGLRSLSFADKLVELNLEMYRTNQRMSDHPFGSPWYQWPLGKKAVGYWHEGDLHVRLHPNLVVWWAASASILALIVLMVIGRIPPGDKAAWLILVGYFINWLPFAWIGRVMFIHSYFSAFLFSLLALAHVMSAVPEQRRPDGILAGLAFIGFLATCHLTYGLPPMFWSWGLV